MNRRVDVLVVGAGAAGLAAARDLSRAGLHVMVIEGRGRVGGRILTIHDRNVPLAIELGAEFVHGEAPDTFAIIRAANLVVNELPDTHCQVRGGKLVPVPDFWGAIDKVRKDIAARLRRKHGGDIPVAEYLEAAKLPSAMRRMFVNFVEGYHAAEVDKISARSLAAGDEENSGPSQNKQFRIPTGYDDLVHWLRTGLDPERTEVRLNTIATSLKWERGNVTLDCKNSTGVRLDPFRAAAAIVTIPHAVLKAGALRIEPESRDREQAVKRLEIGQVFKVALRFRRAFWPDGLNFVHSEEADVPVWWTSLPARIPFITGWAGGPKGELLLNEPEQSRIGRSLAALAHVLNVPRRSIDDLLDGWWMYDWRADPFSQGAYVYVTPGGLAAQKMLARPVQNTLFFAGEATDPQQTGTVAGAIASGRRAARELMQSLPRGRQ